MKTKLLLSPLKGFKNLLFLTIAFLLFGSNAFSQVCNQGYGGNYTSPAGCQLNSRSIGAGEYGTMSLTAGVSYNFGLSSAAIKAAGVIVMVSLAVTIFPVGSLI